MTPEEDRALIDSEAVGDDSLPVHARFGPAIDPERVKRLTEAVRVLRDELRRRSSIDRELASALHFLGFLPLQDVEREKGVEQALIESLLHLQSMIESVFLDCEFE